MESCTQKTLYSRIFTKHIWPRFLCSHVIDRARIVYAAVHGGTYMYVKGYVALTSSITREKKTQTQRLRRNSKLIFSKKWGESEHKVRATHAYVLRKNPDLEIFPTDMKLLLFV